MLLCQPFIGLGQFPLGHLLQPHDQRPADEKQRDHADYQRKGCELDGNGLHGTKAGRNAGSRGHRDRSFLLWDGKTGLDSVFLLYRIHLILLTFLENNPLNIPFLSLAAGVKKSI